MADKTWIAVDIETKDAPDMEGSALDFTRAEIVSLAYWGNGAKGFLTNPELIKEWLTKNINNYNFIWHNGKFDVKVLRRLFGVQLPINWDTLLAESIMPDRPDKLSLEVCVGHELGYPPWKSKEVYQNMATSPIDTIAALNLTDVEYTYQLFLKQFEKLDALGLLQYLLVNNLGFSALDFLADLEYRGIRIDVASMHKLWQDNLKEHKELCSNLYDSYKDLVKEYEEEQLSKHPLKPLREGASAKMQQKYEERLRARKAKYKFNFGAPKQVEWLLTKKLGFPCTNLEGKVSTAKDVLEIYRNQHPMINMLLSLRHNEHDSSCFYQKWDKFNRDGRLHPSYRMDMTKTFRLSCSEPPLQQVKRDSYMRQLFIPSEGMRYAVVDYSMIEPRFIAHYSEDRALLDVFRSKEDYYYIIAKEVLGYRKSAEELRNGDKSIRQVAKTIALSSFYGIGPDKLAYRIRLDSGVSLSVMQTRDYLRRLFDFLDGVRAFRQNLASILQENPVVVNPFGRTLYFKPHEYNHLAFNKIMQCTGSDINLYSQIDLDKYFKSYKIEARCVHLVHDEAIFEYKPEQEDQLMMLLKYIMAERYAEPPFSLKVPIAININTGTSWGVKS